MSDLINQTIGNYQIEALLGSGGMGQVFRAHHIHLERPAALKLMHDHLAHDPGFQARFRQEARAIAALQHPHIIEVYDFGQQDNRFYLAMECMPGSSLRALLHQYARSQQPWPIILGLTLVRQAAEALVYAHIQGMVHRDIKPGNLLLKQVLDAPSQSYTLKISDFGLAHMAEQTLLTAGGGAVGTPAYMSPEQCQGIEIDGRSDLYALGIVLYEVTTGYLPFAAKTLSEAVHQHVHVAPTPPRDVYPDLLPSVEAIILRCLAKRPADRYATARDLISALNAVLYDPPQTLLEAVMHPSLTPVQPPTGGTPPPNTTISGGTGSVPRLQVVDTQGQILQAVELSRSGLTIGRLAKNTVVLDDDMVSREHARVDWDGQQVTVTDLNSRNGSRLGATHLTPRTEQPWSWQEVLRIGPFWLRLESPQPAVLDAVAVVLHDPEPVTAVQHTPADMASDKDSTRIGIVLEPTTLTLDAGQPAVVEVTLANFGRTVDHFTLEVEGVPARWIERPTAPLCLNPGDQTTTRIQVQVPPDPDIQAGDYPVTVRVYSRADPTDTGAARATWTVHSFSEQTPDVTPPPARVQQGEAGSARPGIFLDPITLNILFDQPAEVAVTLANLGHIVDQVMLEVEGVPFSWIQLPAEAARLNPREQTTVHLRVQVPQVPASLAGEYEVMMRARSHKEPAQVGAARALWRVPPFIRQTLAIDPHEARAGRVSDYTLTIRNMGNIPTTYHLQAGDTNRALTYQFDQDEGTLEPGQVTTVALQVSAGGHWVGGDRSYTFHVQLHADAGQSEQTASARFIQPARFAPWLVIILVIVLLACLFVLFTG